MTVGDFEGFIAVQKELIAEVGLVGYLPALWIDTTKEVQVSVLVDAPDENDHERVAGDWALQMAREHDYFLAFKADGFCLKVVARIQGIQQERVVQITDA
jgi:hypothetical protein